ncbi:PilZ domain-containing protein [Rhizobium sp. PAMB 3174]
MRSLKAGRIVFNHEYSTINCTVRNMSATGAKLLVENAMQIPETFELVLSDDTRHACEIKWRKLKEIGVAFVS